MRVNAALIALTAWALIALMGCKAAEQKPAATAPVEAVTCGTIKQIHAVDGLYLAGQPSAQDYALLKEQFGIKTVIDLRKPEEQRGFDEARAVQALGMSYITLPWNGAEELTDEKLDAMRKLLRESERPLLMKCGSSNRVGAGWLAYRVLDEGVALEQAVAQAKEVGMRTPAYETITREYIQKQQSRTSH